jgi:hypothetical protein
MVPKMVPRIAAAQGLKSRSYPNEHRCKNRQTPSDYWFSDCSAIALIAKCFYKKIGSEVSSIKVTLLMLVSFLLLFSLGSTVVRILPRLHGVGLWHPILLTFKIFSVCKDFSRRLCGDCG